VPDQTHPWVSLTSHELTAEIDPHGAQLSALTDRAGHDLLWNGDPAVWAGRAPLLFPIVGALVGGSYRLGSKTYQLPRHGFARGKLFSTEGTSSSTADFRLRADEATLQVYPFRFELDIHFDLTGPTLSLTACVRNKGDADMPASFGYHPAFRWPLPFGQPRSSHFIQFETDEPAPIRRINAAGFLTPDRHPTPVAHRRLALMDALFQDDVLIFDQESLGDLWEQRRAANQSEFSRCPLCRRLDKTGSAFHLHRTLARRYGSGRVFRRLQREARRLRTRGR
jgi:galactose mutarotase-like enzyme